MSMKIVEAIGWTFHILPSSRSGYIPSPVESVIIMFLLILTDLTLGILWWPSSLQHISQSEPSIARLTNHSTGFRHQMVAIIRCWPLTIECVSTPTPHIGSNVPVSFIIRRLHCTGASKYKHRENWKQKPAPAGAKSPAGRWEDSYQDCQGWSFHCSRMVIGSGNQFH